MPKFDRQAARQKQAQFQQQLSQWKTSTALNKKELDQLEKTVFDAKLEAKFGLKAAESVQRSAAERVLRPFNEDSQNVHPANYTSFDAPEGFYEVKRVPNAVVENKALRNQRIRYSSFEFLSKKQVQQFYLNRERISALLDCHQNDIEPVANDWQDKASIPKLAHGLDVLLKRPGIYPTETVNQLNQGRLGSFFTKLPPYSQINEECIAPYFPPGKDKNLLRLAAQ